MADLSQFCTAFILHFQRFLVSYKIAEERVFAGFFYVVWIHNFPKILDSGQIKGVLLCQQ